eukprot:98599_1
MLSPVQKIKMDCIESNCTKTLGIKRQPSEMTSPDTISTTSNSPFASLLPPLKKPKLMGKTQIKPPTFDDPSQSVNILGQWVPPINPQLIAVNPTNPVSHAFNCSMPSNPYCHVPVHCPSNNSGLSIDSVLSTLSQLNSINTTQLNALKTLIFSANDTTVPLHNPNMTPPCQMALTSPLSMQYNPQTPMQIHPIVARVPQPPPVSIPIVARTPIHHPLRTAITTTLPMHPTANIPRVPVARPRRRVGRIGRPPKPKPTLPVPKITCPEDDDVKHAASCHQCKTKKDVKILFYCTKTRPRAYDALKRKVTRCRKKYCESCMAKYYSYNDVSQLRSVKNMSGWCWECPACIGLCTCRACKRKKAKMNHTYSPQSNANSTPKTTTCPTENNTHNPVVVQYTEPKKVPGNPIRGSVQHTPERSIRPPLYKGGLIATLPGPKQTNNNNNVTLLYPQ